MNIRKNIFYAAVVAVVAWLIATRLPLADPATLWVVLVVVLGICCLLLGLQWTDPVAKGWLAAGAFFVLVRTLESFSNIAAVAAAILVMAFFAFTRGRFDRLWLKARARA
ncbi:MAG TPA: hypothetical protein PK609_01415 [Candidatus Paceibacterota bacterium]|nr:hypothetical protein [Candidatus Paceibacterota bacterium]